MTDIGAVREKIQDEMFLVNGQKVRNILFIGHTTDDKDCYVVKGNNNKLIGVALAKKSGDIDIFV